MKYKDSPATLNKDSEAGTKGGDLKGDSVEMMNVRYSKFEAVQSIKIIAHFLDL
jgi:hypothetical protein